MGKVFGLVRRGDHYLLRRLEYPHYKALVDLNRSFPEIKEIEFFDKCCVSEMASAINEGGVFLESYVRESDSFIQKQPQLAFFDIAFILTYQVITCARAIGMLGLMKLKINLTEVLNIGPFYKRP